MRQVQLERNTAETQIKLSLNIDDCQTSNIITGVGFFDHMLNLFARHSGCTLELFCIGDLHIDAHHTVEDCGIVLGKALASCLEDKRGLARYGEATVPMDEVLAQAIVDISGRSYLVFQAELPKATLGNFEVELVEEFLRAVVHNAGITLHIRVLYGQNLHHIIEAIFKALARAMKMAMRKDGEQIPSTKGVI